MAKKTREIVATAPLATQSWLAVVRAYNLCDAVLARRLSELSLHIGEHEILVNLLRMPGITQQELARRCFVAKSGVSMLVTRMERSKLVSRHTDPIDARVKLLFLTPVGRVLAESAHRMQTEVVAAMANGMSKRDLTIVMQAMQRASSALEGMLDSDSRKRVPRA